MSDAQDARAVADREAADWHVRLGERPVSAATLAEFKSWRAAASNADAYHRLETLWRTAGSLSGDPDVQGLTRDVLKASAPNRKRSSGSELKVVGAVVATVVVVAVGLSLWLPSRPSYATVVGEQRLVRLEDGTRVRLDTDTRIEVRFDGDERRVLLKQGQALFTVTHDAARPFRVAAGPTEVTALGTTFDVRREEGGARVTLVEGSVAVTDAKPRDARRWRLSPGQQVETTERDATPRRVDATVATSWSEGRLVFRNTPLKDAVAEVNRYLPGKIELAEGPQGDVAVSGVFTAGDQDAFVAAASDLLDLTARPLKGGGVRLSPSSGGG